MQYQRLQAEIQLFLYQAYKSALSDMVKRGKMAAKNKKLYTSKVNKSKV